jgi:16S rRNA (cytosine1402-N4)-methyltransferase
MDRRQELSAQEVVNTYGAEDLKRIIVDYGEEPPKLAGKIAAAIVQNRPFKETSELADLIADNYRGRRGRIHPATRTFQALRIAVNDELGQVEEVLELLPSLLNKNGKLAVISFHSLEDRLVKRYFKEQSISGYEADLQILTKKPVSGANEDVHNPRSRSARLRVAVKK